MSKQIQGTTQPTITLLIAGLIARDAPGTRTTVLKAVWAATPRMIVGVAQSGDAVSRSKLPTVLIVRNIHVKYWENNMSI